MGRKSNRHRWDKTDPAAAVIRAEREIQKVEDAEKKTNPKKFADAESEKKQLKAKMKNTESNVRKEGASKQLTEEQIKKLENERKRKILEKWMKDTVPRAKQKNMLEKNTRDVRCRSI